LVGVSAMRRQNLQGSHERRRGVLSVKGRRAEGRKGGRAEGVNGWRSEMVAW
jgi:hypothetical protein